MTCTPTQRCLIKVVEVSDFWILEVTLIKVATVRPLVFESDGFSPSSPPTCFVLLGTQPLLDVVADSLDSFSCAIISGIAKMLNLRNGSTAVEKAAAILEHLGRPEEKRNEILTRMQQAQIARLKKKEKPTEDRGDALDADEVEDHNERLAAVLGTGSDEEEEDVNVFTSVSKGRPEIQAARVQERRNIGTSTPATTVVSTAADSQVDDNVGPSAAAAATEVRPSSSTSDKDAACAEKEQVLPLPHKPPPKTEPPPGCVLKLCNPTTLSSPTWVGRLPAGAAYLGCRSISRSFAEASLGNDSHQSSLTNVHGQRASMGESHAQAVVLQWLWDWFNLSQEDKDKHSAMFGKFRTFEARASSTSSSSSSTALSTPSSSNNAPGPANPSRTRTSTSSASDLPEVRPVKRRREGASEDDNRV
jgi:hypothetical protein